MSLLRREDSRQGEGLQALRERSPAVVLSPSYLGVNSAKERILPSLAQDDDDNALPTFTASSITARMSSLFVRKFTMQARRANFPLMTAFDR